jgi:hypothetical protein
MRRLEWLDEDVKAGNEKLAQDCVSNASQLVDLAAAPVMEELGRRMLFVVDRLEPEEEAESAKVRAAQKQQGSEEEEDDEVAERRRKYYLLEVIHARELHKITRIQSLMAEGKAKPSDHRQTCTGVCKSSTLSRMHIERGRVRRGPTRAPSSRICVPRVSVA